MKQAYNKSVNLTPGGAGYPSVRLSGEYETMVRSFKAILLLCILVVSACTKLSDLDPPSIDKYIKLSQDEYVHIKYEDRSRFVLGLRKGIYVLVGEDDEYMYFKGQGDTVLVLTNERVDRFLNEGYLTPYSERHRAQMSYAGGEGGLMVPKVENELPIKIFYLVRTSSSFDNPVHGPVVSVGNSMADGALGYYDFDIKGKEILEKYPIVSGLPSISSALENR